MSDLTKHDSDAAKGAVEEEEPQRHQGNPYVQGQLGHRDENEELKEGDSDFPEPGGREEHTGERE